MGGYEMLTGNLASLNVSAQSSPYPMSGIHKDNMAVPDIDENQFETVVPLRRRREKRKGEGDTTPSQSKRAARGTSAGGRSHSVWKLEWQGRYATKLTLVRI